MNSTKELDTVIADPFSPHIESEVAPLESVIVHRPGKEIERLTPQNHDELLFDDLLSPTSAKAEHDYFVEVMRNQGIEVAHFDKLLIETLEIREAREHVLSHTVNRLRLGPMLAPALEEWASSLPAPEVAAICIEGITLGEWNQVTMVPSLVGQTLDQDDFLIGPLPNHLFTRDASVWLYGGVAINSMNRVARQRESLHYSTIYNWHPRFSNSTFTKWTNGTSGAVRSVEGGDILVLGNGLIAVGMSERTTPQGVERLTSRLFASGKADRVLAVMLPHRREFMHLDTVLTQVDEDAFIVFPELIETRTVCLRRENDQIKLDKKDRPLRQALEEELERSLRFVIPQGSTSELSREQWNDGFNMLTLSPGQVVAYSRTPRAIRALRDNNIDVLEIDGSELGRGRGGARCMSCPIRRTPVKKLIL